jgi:hypothetical protein
MICMALKISFLDKALTARVWHPADSGQSNDPEAEQTVNPHIARVQH